MKTYRLFCRVIAILTMLLFGLLLPEMDLPDGVGQVDAAANGPILLSENWESGIDPLKWLIYGSPQPSLYPGEGLDGSIALDPNGDGWYDSGVMARTALDITSGINVAFWIRGHGPLGAAYNGIAVGLNTCSPTDNPEQCRTWMVDINPDPESYKVAYSSVYGGTQEPWSPLDGSWHKYQFTITADGFIHFYRDDDLIYSTTQPVDFNIYHTLWLDIRGRSINSYYYIDDILVTGGDNKGPVTADVVANPNPVEVGTNVILNANVDDATTGGSNIASAEFNINLDGSSFSPMDAADGTFDAVSEDVTADIGSFTEPAIHKICVRGTDAVGNKGAEECIFLAVYDPEGGFVTGGGWIDSPVGAYVANPLLTGKATFGFVSKYKKGATTPTGETEFQFRVADLNFHSDSYDWLVVAGPKAMYKGTGTINGTGTYGFMLSAIDEKLTPSTDVDLFRIKVWDKDNSDALVYDNQIECSDDADDTDPCTGIEGGNIVIHQGK